MANVTTSTTVDNFMQAADAAAARASLGVAYGSSAGTVAQGNDSRLSDSRTPTSHASTHAAAGSDPITITSAQISGSLTQNTSGTAAGLSATLAVASGGTGVTASSGANSVVLRDANQNITANAYINNLATITASGTPVVLTVASAPVSLVIGSGGQTIQLPNATTLQNGTIFSFNNNQSSGVVLVNNNSGSLIVSVPSGGYTTVVLLSNATAAGTWDRHDQSPSNVSWSTNTFDYPGSITSATWNGNAVAANRGGTGQTAYTDGQLLIGNTATGGLSKSTLTAGSNVTITNGNGAITIAATGGVPATDVQIFTSSGTWTKPTGAKSVHVVCIGGGGGAGSGRRGASLSAIGGGGGAAGGGYTQRTVDASLLGATESVTVGAGGAGGMSITSNDSNGQSGTSGGVSSLGTWIFAAGGSNGAAGTNTGGTAGSATSQRAMIVGGGGGNSSTGAGASPGFASQAGGAGGGGGGGITVSTGFLAGGTGAIALASFVASSSTAAGTTDGASGSNGLSAVSNWAVAGMGGGGGAGSVLTSGGTGGNGGNYGGGGGGGGGSLNGFASGAGGAGGAGIIVITTYF